MSKIKFYKNPDRVEHEAPLETVLQYEKFGVKPVPVSGAISGNAIIIKPEKPPTQKSAVPQPAYAEVAESLPIKLGHLPNIGVTDNGWSSLNPDFMEDEIIEDFDPNKIIDNNDYVEIPSLSDAGERLLQSTKSIENKTVDTIDLLDTLYNLEQSQYILIVDGVPICSGPLNEIQEEATLFVFGDHELCKGTGPVPLENIMIFKKAKVKVGLFFE
jgi:hypothetical protein